LRFISLRPDQVASIAHTFTSTRPIGRQTSRMMSSVMSVGTLAAFFGQLIQMKPDCPSSGISRWRSCSSFARSVTKM